MRLVTLRSVLPSSWDPSISFIQAVDAMSPVAHWRMGDVVGSVSLVDRIAAAAAALTGTAGTSYALGQTGMVRNDADMAVAFNGGYAVSAAGQNWSLGSGDFSAVTFVKTTSLVNAQVPFGIRSGGGFDVLFLLMINQTVAGKVALTGWNGSNKIVQIGTTTITDGKPHAIGMTYEAATNTARGYVDGVLGCTFQYLTAQSRPTGAAMSVKLAANVSASQPFKGTLDEAILFDHQLTDADMATLASYVSST